MTHEKCLHCDKPAQRGYLLCFACFVAAARKRKAIRDGV